MHTAVDRLSAVERLSSMDNNRARDVFGQKNLATSSEHDRDAGDGQRRQQPRAVAERRTGAGRRLVAVSRPRVGRARFLAVRSFTNVARGRLYRFVEGSSASRCEQNTMSPSIHDLHPFPAHHNSRPINRHKVFLANHQHTRLITPAIPAHQRYFIRHVIVSNRTRHERISPYRKLTR